MLTALEWSGSLLGLLGAYLLATHGRVSRYGWIAFLAANVVMMAFALGIERYGLLIQQVAGGFRALYCVDMATAKDEHVDRGPAAPTPSAGELASARVSGQGNRVGARGFSRAA
jgi:hypothetical protein